MAEEKSTKKPDKSPTAPSDKTTKSTSKKSDKPTKSDNPAKKPKKGLLIGLIAAGVVVIAGILTAVLLRHPADPSDPKAKLSYSDSFFIQDGGKYTLWNSHGERLTEDEYELKSDFLAGYAFVKKGDQYGIIREDGKMSVDFGKYGEISASGGLFLAQDGNTKLYSLLTGSGTILAQGEDFKLTSSGSSNAFAMLQTADQYQIFTYSGQSIVAYPINGEIDEEPKLASSNDFGAFFYDNYNVIFDVRSGKTLASFQGPRYAFNDSTEDRSQVLLKREADDDEEEDEGSESPNYLLLIGGKVVELNETKYYSFTALDYLLGYDTYEAVALLDKDYKVEKWLNVYVALKDSNNYAIKNDDGNVDIVYRGEVIKTFDQEADLESGVLYEDLYAIKNDGKFRFYHLDGSQAFEHEYVDVWTLFNKNHHSIVADTEGEYYFIDAKGNRLGDKTFKRAYLESGGYEVKNADGKYAIADKNAEFHTDFVYESVYCRSAAVDHNIWTGRYSYEDHDILDLDNHRVLLSHVNPISFNAQYFTVKNADGKYEYYTYDGVLFYTSQD